MTRLFLSTAALALIAAPTIASAHQPSPAAAKTAPAKQHKSAAKTVKTVTTTKKK